MWPEMVEFRSASSEIRGRKNKEVEEEDDEERLVKYKFADMYVGRINWLAWYCANVLNPSWNIQQWRRYGGFPVMAGGLT